MFLEKGVLKMYSKFTEEQPCRSATLIELQIKSRKWTPVNNYSPVNLFHIFRTSFPKNNSEGMFLHSFLLTFTKARFSILSRSIKAARTHRKTISITYIIIRFYYWRFGLIETWPVQSRTHFLWLKNKTRLIRKK